MTEKPLAEPNIAESLLDKAALSLADAKASSLKAQELKEQLLSGRSAVEALIGSLFAKENAAAEFAAAVEEAEEQQEQVAEQLESLEERLDTVFEALTDGEEAAAPALPEWFSLPAGFGSLADLAADVEDQLLHLDDAPEPPAEAQSEEPVLSIENSLHQTLLAISAELSALNLLADEPAAAEAEPVLDAVIEDDGGAAAAAAASVAEILAGLTAALDTAEEATEAEPEPAAEAEEAAEEPAPPAAPLQEVSAAHPGYNPTWMALPQQESAAEPMEAPTAPLQDAAQKAESTFAPAWFKATEEKEAAAAVKPAAEAETAAAAPVVDEEDPVEIAARAMEARRLQEETEKMAAQLAEAERMRLKAEEELRRILQEIEGETQNDADDDVAALLRGFRH